MLRRFAFLPMFAMAALGRVDTRRGMSRAPAMPSGDTNIASPAHNARADRRQGLRYGAEGFLAYEPT